MNPNLKNIILILFLFVILIFLTCTRNSLFTAKLAVIDRSDEFECNLIPEGYFQVSDGQVIKLIDHDYKIMKYEVTNTEYLSFLQELQQNNELTISYNTVNAYHHGDSLSNPGEYLFLDMNNPCCHLTYTSGTFQVETGFDHFPVVGITWIGAQAFAEHYGGCLPSSDEWEKAAVGLTGYQYPYGSQLEYNRANFQNSGDPFDNGATPVGYYNGENHNGYQTLDSPSQFGLYDMVGNVVEFTTEIYRSEHLTGYIARGGGWSWGAHHAVVYDRVAKDPQDATMFDFGFRVVWIMNAL